MSAYLHGFIPAPLRARTVGPLGIGSATLLAMSVGVLAVLSTGCNSAPVPDRAEPTAPKSSLSASAASSALVSQERDAEVAAVATAYDGAWNAGDAAALAALYTDDAEQVSILGTVLPGAATIRAQHVFLFAGPFRGSQTVSTVRRITFLTGTIAVLDVNVDLTGYVALSPGIRSTAPGVLRARFKHSVEKRGGAWRITSTQGTAVQPGF